MIELKKVHCFFEQSGTFKNEFKKLGYEAEDYDIQNNFGETDNVIDLFGEIEKEYDNLTRQDKTRQDKTVFANIDPCQDLIMAFFPCIYFTGWTNPLYFTLECINYRSLSLMGKFDKMLERADNRNYFFKLILKLTAICLEKKIRMVFENPYSEMHYLINNYIKAPDLIDFDRTKRGDYFKKPTSYWFFNLQPSIGYSFQKPKEHHTIISSKGNTGGLCSEERSMISPDYARNFICDFILGKVQEGGQQPLFDA